MKTLPNDAFANRGSLRDFIKKNAPDFVRDGVQKLRDALAGPGVDEAMLKSLRFMSDDDPVPRLNLVLPSLSAAYAFGGVHTGLELLFALASRLKATRRFDVRFIVDSAPRESDNVLRQYNFAAKFPGSTIDLLAIPDRKAVVPTRRDDIFIGFNWWTNINIMPVMAAQAAHFGVPRRPRFHIMQDYEPSFFPFSSPQMYALYSYNAPDTLYGIFNSSLLYEHYKAQGNSVAKAFVFEPKIPARMRTFLGKAEVAAKKKTIVIYGRPNIPRNCFSIVKAGLKRFAERHPRLADWEILSVGTPHKPFVIAPGRLVASRGKLSLEGYASLLCESAVGLSLMASPHPSSPPLEMAHFGLLTITNKYAAKDLSRLHQNITSLADIMPDTVADTLAEACDRFGTDTRIGRKNRPLADFYLSDTQFECLPEIAAAVLSIVR